MRRIAGDVEYLYSCALYSSYDCRHANDGMVLGKIMALRRVVTPQFPNSGEVLFFYTGIGTSGYYRVFGQRCTRR